MTKELLILILNLIFAGFLLFGFLFGLKGIKKSSIRLVCFIVAVVLAIFITPVVSKAVMNIQITVDGARISINEFILQKINEIPEISELTSKSPTIQTLIENIPIMIGNIFVFVLLSYALSFLSWIVYLVFSSVINKEYKAKKEQGEKVKKHRLLGGLVGAVQAFLLVGITFLPICGFVGIVRDIQNTASAEEIQTEQSSSSKMLIDNLPQEVKIVIDAYSDSALSSVGNMFGLGDKLFNDISSIKVGNEKIALRDEIVNFVKVYDNVSFLFDIKIDESNISSLDYDKLIQASDYAFDSNIIKSALPDLFNYLFEQLQKLDRVQNDQDLLDILDVIKSDITSDNNVVGNLKNEVNCVLNVFKILSKSGIIDEISFAENSITTENLNNIVEILLKDDKKVFNDLVDTCFESKILNRAVVYSLAKGIYIMEDQLRNLVNDQSITLTKLNLKDSNLIVKKAEVKSLLSSSINIVNDVKDFNFSEIKNDKRLVFDLPLGNILKNSGIIMNSVQNMNIFANNGIYNQILDAFKQSDYNKFVDFDILKEENIWVTETQNMSVVIDKFINSNIISYVELSEDGHYTVKTENISKIIDKLDDISVINGQNKTLLSQIIEPIYNSKLFEKIINLGFEQMSNIVENVGKNIIDNCKLGKLNLEKIYDEDEKTKVLNFLNNTISYIKNIDIDNLKQDPFYTIMNSDLTLLGQCLDSIKASSLFADNNEQKGVYSNLIDALNTTKFTEYIDFNCTLKNNFRFNQEFTRIQDSIQKLLTTNITTEENTMSLLKYIVDVGNFDVIFTQIDKQVLKDIFTPLMESEILRPIGVLVVNKINEQVKNLVGEYGEYIPTDLTDLEEEQIEQIVEVMASISEIIEDVTKEDFDMSTYLRSEDSDKIVDVLEKLQDNATTENGVFKPAYDSMLEYIKNDDEIGETITPIIEQNTNEGIIDWAQVVAQLKNLG